jgi:hypothetical protein
MAAAPPRSKRRFSSTVASADYAPLPDSMPPLDSESQRSVVVIDSQGISSEAGPGVLRDQLVKAERDALVADARANVMQAEAALKVADAAVRAAQVVQAARARKVNEMKQLLYDLTGGR